LHRDCTDFSVDTETKTAERRPRGGAQHNHHAIPRGGVLHVRPPVTGQQAKETHGTALAPAGLEGKTASSTLARKVAEQYWPGVGRNDSSHRKCGLQKHRSDARPPCLGESGRFRTSSSKKFNDDIDGGAEQRPRCTTCQQVKRCSHVSKERKPPSMLFNG